jgi:site-specific DNA-methyltransferase (adenine-specific)
MNKLYFGDNLIVLRDHIPDESVDLIYLDPPFNSNKNYNILFNSPKGQKSEAQITAFEDTWHWGDEAEREYTEILHQPNTNVAEMIQAFRRFLVNSDMMAYLTMMTIRLLELHRVLKPTGSLYLHCDPTASHYLKVMLDMVFGAENYRSEIVWKRSGSHGGSKRWGPLHDTIFFYSKSSNFTWNKVFEKYDDSYLEKFYRFSDKRGRYRLVTLTGAGTRTGDSGKSWRGVNPTSVGRHWAVPLSALSTITDEQTIKKLSTQEKLDLLDSAGLIYWPPKGSVPQQKRYLDEAEGVSIQDVITDILPISSQAAERMGYPTQKPLALLERIINASSNPGDIVLDPFCGCGTAVEAAQKLDRQWIGIDITSLAISLIEKRLRDRFPGVQFEVIGTPKDLEGARDLANRDKYQFQWWACSLVNAQPYQGKKKGADSGIDGLIFFQDELNSAKKIIVSVKGGEGVSVSQIRDLKGTVDREKAAIGIYITLAEPTRPMQTEAVSAGYYDSPLGTSYPKIQILTIEGLLSGHQNAEYPDLSRGGLTFKKSKPTEKDPGQLEFGM